MSNEWISTKSRLPEKNGRYLVTTVVLQPSGEVREVLAITWKDGQWWIINNPFDNGSILAWQELPEVYQGE